MACQSFISIRLEPGFPTRVYIDDMTTPRHTAQTVNSIRLESPATNQLQKGAMVTVEAMRWPPTGYDGGVTIPLSGQWPFGVREFKPDDISTEHPGRTFPRVDFEYDAAAGRLSWNQVAQDNPTNASPAPAGRMQGSVQFGYPTPIWYITLRLDKTPLPDGTWLPTSGLVFIDGQEIV